METYWFRLANGYKHTISQPSDCSVSATAPAMMLRPQVKRLAQGRTASDGQSHLRIPVYSATKPTFELLECVQHPTEGSS